MSPPQLATKLSPTSSRTQARVIDAVIEVISEFGISKTTFANVAAQAGVSQGLLVFHFKTKEGMLSEALSRMIQEYEQSWRQVMLAPDPAQRITGLIRADFSPLICSREKLAVWISFWGEAAAQPLYHRICMESDRARHEALRSCFEELLADTGGPDPQLLTNCVDAYTNGLWLQMHLEVSPLTREEARESALAHLRLLLPAYAHRF